MQYQKSSVLLSFALFFCGCASTPTQTQPKNSRPVGFWKNKEAVVQVLHFYSKLATDDTGLLPVFDADNKFTTRYAAELGTGAVVNVNGLVITNNHVIANNPLRFAEGMPIVPPELIGTPPQPDMYAVCTVPLGLRTCHPAELVGVDETHDLAKLHTDYHFSQAVEFADDNKLELGDEIYFWGSVFDYLPPSPFFGRFTNRLDLPYFEGSTSFPKESLPLLFIDVNVSKGSSGGPVFNGEGKCIGFVKAYTNPLMLGGRALGVTIPSTTVMKFDKANPWPRKK